VRSKNSKPFTKAEAAHLDAVKSVACVICDHPPPSEAHHIVQGDHFTTVALCTECHTGRGGWHREKTMWRIRKWQEIDALNETLRRVLS
jgi:hypothetical protein